MDLSQNTSVVLLCFETVSVIPWFRWISTCWTRGDWTHPQQAAFLLLSPSRCWSISMPIVNQKLWRSMLEINGFDANITHSLNVFDGNVPILLKEQTCLDDFTTNIWLPKGQIIMYWVCEWAKKNQRIQWLIILFLTKKCHFGVAQIRHCPRAIQKYISHLPILWFIAFPVAHKNP